MSNLRRHWPRHVVFPAIPEPRGVVIHRSATLSRAVPNAILLPPTPSFLAAVEFVHCPFAGLSGRPFALPRTLARYSATANPRRPILFRSIARDRDIVHPRSSFAHGPARTTLFPLKRQLLYASDIARRRENATANGYEAPSRHCNAASCREHVRLEIGVRTDDA